MSKRRPTHFWEILMMKSFRILGFSLVELMLVTGALSGVALIVMQIGKNSIQTQGDAISSGDYIQLQKEVSFLISEGKSCSASLKNVKFTGSSIKTTPVSGLELWSADQVGVRSRKKFYESQTLGKLTIDSISFTMPDYTAGKNFTVGINQNFKGELKISGSKINLGKMKKFNDHTESINLIFDTDASGLSRIKSCYLVRNLVAPTVTEGAACIASAGNIAVDVNGLLLSCQSGAWTAQSGGGTELGASRGFATTQPTGDAFGNWSCIVIYGPIKCPNPIGQPGTGIEPVCPSGYFREMKYPIGGQHTHTCTKL